MSETSAVQAPLPSAPPAPIVPTAPVATQPFPANPETVADLPQIEPEPKTVADLPHLDDDAFKSFVRRNVKWLRLELQHDEMGASEEERADLNP